MTMNSSSKAARQARQQARIAERRKRTLLWAALGLAVIAVIGFFAWRGSQTQATQKAEDVTELKIEDLAVGDGAEAVKGNTVLVHYTGWLTDGTKFDSSLDRGQPFQFTLGAGRVIQGWDIGVAGMKVGGKRKLTIPPDLGYGASGAGGVIPPDATLIFEVEILEIK